MKHHRHRCATTALLILLAVPACAQDGLEPAEHIRRSFTKTEHRIPMRDGKHLFTVVYSPKDTSEPWPILMMRTPYSVGP